MYLRKWPNVYFIMCVALKQICVLGVLVKMGGRAANYMLTLTVQSIDFLVSVLFDQHWQNSMLM